MKLDAGVFGPPISNSGTFKWDHDRTPFPRGYGAFPRQHGIFYSTTQPIYSSRGGRGPSPLPHSQLCSCVDECEQTFSAVSASTPQFSALEKHIVAAAAGPYAVRRVRKRREKEGTSALQRLKERVSQVTPPPPGGGGGGKIVQLHRRRQREPQLRAQGTHFLEKDQRAVQSVPLLLDRLNKPYKNSSLQ